MKINDRLICIPPFVSVTWEQVMAIFTEENSDAETKVLVLRLNDLREIKIPNLAPEILEIIFNEHSKYLEGYFGGSKFLMQKESPLDLPIRSISMLLQQMLGSSSLGLSPKLKFGLPGMDSMETLFQHNPAQSKLNDFSDEFLNKISNIAKMISGNDLTLFSKPEPNCSCLHCQISKHINKEMLETELISDQDLQFHSWDIKENGNKLYTVTNPLNREENYNVFLGSPVDCSCGEKNCEHIKAVLHS